jgi:ParE toxin of type II toxin-antitoxin system, parDE
MKLIFTDEAKFDLDHIGDWIADHNPVRAVTFVDEITARCAKLTEMPHAYPLVARHGKRGSGGWFTTTISSSIASPSTQSKLSACCTAPATSNRSTKKKV